jgi:hypothetical protein
MHSGNFTRVALLALLPLATGGCGFILVHGPPQGHEQMVYISCTESDAGPIVDGIWAGLNLFGAIYAASLSEEDFFTPAERNAYVASGIVWTGFSSAAAVVGLNKTKKCRAAKEQLARRQAEPRIDSMLGGHPRPLPNPIRGPNDRDPGASR